MLPIDLASLQLKRRPMVNFQTTIAGPWQWHTTSSPGENHTTAVSNRWTKPTKWRCGTELSKKCTYPWLIMLSFTFIVDYDWNPWRKTCCGLSRFLAISSWRHTLLSSNQHCSLYWISWVWGCRIRSRDCLAMTIPKGPWQKDRIRPIDRLFNTFIVNEWFSRTIWEILTWQTKCQLNWHLQKSGMSPHFGLRLEYSSKASLHLHCAGRQTRANGRNVSFEDRNVSKCWNNL